MLEAFRGGNDFRKISRISQQTCSHNASKGGVVVVDRYKENYNVARISNQWPMTVFHSLLNIAALNGFMILNENIKNPQNLRRILAEDLCKQHMLSIVNVASPPSLTKELIRRILEVEIPQVQRAPVGAVVTTRRCFK
ncbi:hypothetical protein J6590_001191 [Homalodisca vitripennis]|nr:hypothetical protein J6590_001191 [Homalodisca vitripennis]